jgi:hypothetical protein
VNSKKVTSVKFEIESKAASVVQRELKTQKHNIYKFLNRDGQLFSDKYNIQLHYIIDAVNYEFDLNQVEILIGDCRKNHICSEYDICQYIRSAYQKMLHATEKRDILNRFGYVKRVLERISL